MRAEDQRRLARLGVVASVQPIHAASDRSTAEACWADRLADAYPWRGLAEAGALLACGSDAPIESVNPWLGIFAAVHRRHVTDRRGDWLARQSLGAAAALSGYTTGPARGVGADNEGHLAPGAVADLACLDVDLATLLAADERLAEARSELTLVGGRIVHGG